VDSELTDLEIELLKLGQAGLARIVRAMWAFISSEIERGEVQEIEEYIREIQIATALVEQRKELMS